MADALVVVARLFSAFPLLYVALNATWAFSSQGILFRGKKDLLCLRGRQTQACKLSKFFFFTFAFLFTKKIQKNCGYGGR